MTTGGCGGVTTSIPLRAAAAAGHKTGDGSEGVKTGIPRRELCAPRCLTGGGGGRGKPHIAVRTTTDAGRPSSGVGAGIDCPSPLLRATNCSCGR